jgi:hypothetical protein
MVKKLTKENEFRCSRGQFQDFKDSLIWQDLQQEIRTWISNAHIELENTALNEIDTAHIRGCIRSARDLLQLPDTIISILEEEG